MSYLGVTIPGPSKRERERERELVQWIHMLRWAALHGGHDGGGGVEGAERDGRGGVRGVKGNDLEQLCAGWDLSKQRGPVVQVARVIRESDLGLQLDLCVATEFGWCGGQGSLSLSRRKHKRNGCGMPNKPGRETQSRHQPRSHPHCNEPRCSRQLWMVGRGCCV